MKKFFIHENDLNTTIDVLWKSSMQKVSDNKYVFPGKDFDSSNVGGHINCLITRFWTHLHESPMVSDVRNLSFYMTLLKHQIFCSERIVKTLFKLCVANFENLT